jgi:transcription elongation factor B subunit 1
VEEQEVIDVPMVKLISSQGHEFLVSRDCVMASGTIRTLLSGPASWKENAGQVMPTVHFEEIDTATLEKVIQYFHYKQKYDNTAPPLPKFHVDIDSIVPLLLAANFLDS